MSQQDQPYKITIPQTARKTQNLLNNSLKSAALSLGVEESVLRFVGILDVAPYPAVRVFRGPEDGMWIFGVWRRVLRKGVGKDQQFLYFGVFVVDLTKEKLEPVTILEKTKQSAETVLDFTVHPNTKTLTLIYQSKLQNYILTKSPTSLFYTLTLHQTLPLPLPLPTPILPTNLNYNPTGQYLLGIALTQNPETLKLFRYEAETKKMVVSQDMLGKCLDLRYFQFLGKWSVGVGKTGKVVVAGGKSQVCLVDLGTMRYELVGQTQNPQSITIPLVSNQSSGSYEYDAQPISAGYLNATKQGYFVTYDSYDQAAYIYEFPAKSPNLTQTGIFKSLPFDPLKDTKSLIKCIDIPSINAFACIRHNSPKIYLTKLDRSQNKVYSLGNIEVMGDVKEMDSFFNFGKLEEIFYSQRTVEICGVGSLRVVCYGVGVECTGKSGVWPVGMCDRVCKSEDANSYWNPIKMSCQKCQKCSCKDPTQSFNPYFSDCTLDCSLTPNAVPYSQHSLPQKCLCNAPYTWHNSFQTCRFNCSTLPYTDHRANYTTMDANDCLCLPGFRFLRKLDPVGSTGYCGFLCPNGGYGEERGGEIWCGCGEKGVWDPKGLKCVAKSGQAKDDHKENQTSRGPLIWPIILLVCLFIALLAILIFIIYKKRKSSQSAQSQPQQIPPSSDRNPTHSSHSQKKSQQQLKQQLQPQKFCTVCNINQSEANCMGPCQHYYHFYCIKERIDQGNLECPVCGRKLEKGLGDVRVVEREDEVWTISDN